MDYWGLDIGGHSPDDGSDVEDTVEAGDDGGPGPEGQTEAAGVVRCEARGQLVSPGHTVTHIMLVEVTRLVGLVTTDHPGGWGGARLRPGAPSLHLRR